MNNLILFGPPGSGKGTQAARLVEKYQLLHISTGDLFRSEIGNKTPLGMEAKSYIDKGELVPDSITIGMLRNKVLAHPESKGIIFDGFPRTHAQAEALDELLGALERPISHLIELDVTEEEIVKRLLNRGIESGRSDDKDEEIIRNRIHVYRQQTSPVFDYYQLQNLAFKVQGEGSVDEIFQAICSILEA
jgi:adenylate kinase